jgi:hypothetical protein
VLDITGGRGLAVCDSLRSLDGGEVVSSLTPSHVARVQARISDVEVLGDTDWEQVERLAYVGCVGGRLLDRGPALAEV